MISMFVRKARNGILLKRIDKYNFQSVELKNYEVKGEKRLCLDVQNAKNG